MPHFYLADWFYVLFALAAVIIVVSGYRFRLHRTRIREKQLYRAMRERLELLELLAQQLKQANRDLRRLSYVDGLTGIPNRRQFEKVLDLEWRRACRVGTALFLIMIDAERARWGREGCSSDHQARMALA